MSDDIRERSAELLGRELLNEIKTAIGGGWESLSAAQRESIARTATRVMDLELRHSQGEDVAEKLQAVRSTVADWKVWTELAIEEAFWKGVQKVAAAIGTFLAAFATDLIDRLVPGVELDG